MSKEELGAALLREGALREEVERLTEENAQLKAQLPTASEMPLNKATIPTETYKFEEQEYQFVVASFQRGFTKYLSKDALKNHEVMAMLINGNSPLLRKVSKD